MARLVMWRVRVRRSVETWVDVEAPPAVAGGKLEAERVAWNVPGVVSVFPGSAILGSESAIPERPPGVED